MRVKCAVCSAMLLTFMQTLHLVARNLVASAMRGIRRQGVGIFPGNIGISLLKILQAHII